MTIFAPSMPNSTGKFESKPAVFSKLWERLPWYLPALISIGLGCVLLEPIATFAQSGSWRLLALTFGSYSEGIWASIFIAVGLAHVGLKIRDHRGRIFTSLLLSAMFGMLASLMWASTGILSTGTIAYGGIAALAIWATPRR